MKDLNDYKDDIHRCSKCGLCQSVCPVYQVTGNDCSVSRGKFIMLNGILKGDLELNQNINKYIDMCLKCNACKNFCPSNIDARQIFIAVKAQYFKKVWYSKLTRIFNSPFVFNSFLNCAKFAVSIYRFINFDKIVKAFYPLLLKLGFLGKKVILANEFVSIGKSKSVISQKQKFAGSKFNVVYFKGCVNEYINPKVKNAAELIFDKMGVNVLPTDFRCCGVPFLSSGNVEQFKAQAEYNLSQIPDEFDYFLTDCASCQGAFKDYENYIEDEKLLKKLKMINEKSINIVDFVVKNSKSFSFPEKISFTFHKPCHLESIEFISEFLNKAKNIEYKEMKDFDSCCGFSGEFAIKNVVISEEISAKKIKNALDTKSDFLVTSCPACVLGLNQGLIENQKQADVMNFVELIAMSDIEPENSKCKPLDENIYSVS